MALGQECDDVPEPGEHYQVLVPGLRVVARGRDRLQVGLDPTRALQLPRTPAVERALALLSSGAAIREDAEGAEVREVVGSLAARGFLVESALLTQTTSRGPRTPEAGDVAALALADPAAAADRLARRRATKVGLIGGLGVDAAALLGAAGLVLAEDVLASDVVLVAQVGELDRAALDPLVRELVPHVVVRLRDGVGIVGPFVVPGHTACLRCVDAHLSAPDPALDAVTARYAAATSRPRADGTVEPVDSALATMAVAWAVRDVVSHVDGLRPSTWSSTIRLAPTLAAVTSVTWLRHPECGCAWADLPGVHDVYRTSVTLEA